MTDLLTHPLWREQDLGKPLPDCEFGVSVCLPLWRHVIGYEEKDPAVLAKLQSGYPRFCCPPAIADLFAAAEDEFAGQGERCLVFPSEVHARRCLDFVERAGFHGGRTEVFGDEKLGAVVFPAAAYDTARRFWRFCGEVVSTRQACHALGRVKTAVTAEQGRAAQAAIKRRLAEFAGQPPEDVFLFPSGMAATFAVHRMLLSQSPGLRTMQLDFPYVDVLKVQQHFGAGALFFPLVSEAEYAHVEAALHREAVAGIFCEAPSNPLLKCVDFARLREIAARIRPEAPLVVDDTIATSVNVDAFRFADVVTTSLTKAFSGRGDVMAGSAVLNRQSPHHDAFAKFLAEHADHELWRDDAVALESNSRDFAERAAAMSRNSIALTEFLRSHPRVARVWHSTSDGGPGYRAVRRPGGGHGCLLSFVLKDAAASPRFYDALRVTKGPSLGTNFSLVCPYTLLAHYDELDWAEQCGADRNLIRVSAGLEAERDLLGRFAAALSL